MQVAFSLVGEVALLLRPNLADTPSLKKQLAARWRHDWKNARRRRSRRGRGLRPGRTPASAAAAIAPRSGAPARQVENSLARTRARRGRSTWGTDTASSGRAAPAAQRRPRHRVGRGGARRARSLRVTTVRRARSADDRGGARATGANRRRPDRPRVRSSDRHRARRRCGGVSGGQERVVLGASLLVGRTRPAGACPPAAGGAGRGDNPRGHRSPRW